MATKVKGKAALAAAGTNGHSLSFPEKKVSKEKRDIEPVGAAPGELPGIPAGAASGVLLEVETLRRCAFNRRHEHPEKVTEIAESIRVNGQLQPILVRPVSGDPKHKWEVVLGWTRTQACRQLGQSVSATVRELTDAEAAVLCAVENFNREQLSPMEEAETFAGLLEIEKSPGMPMTRRDVAERLGLIEAVGEEAALKRVGRRMQLVKLSPDWKRAAADAMHPVSRWGVGHLEYLSRFPAEQQARLYDDMQIGKRPKQSWEQEHWKDTIEKTMLTDLVDRMTSGLQVLKSAPWSLDDEGLLHAAGSCTACRKRSEAETALFDLDDFAQERHGEKAKPGERCLDEACWKKKCAAYLKRQEAALRLEHPEIKRMSPEKAEYGRVEKVKKGAPGAVPVMWSDGAQAGKLGWVKEQKKEQASRGGPAGRFDEGGAEKGAAAKKEIDRKRFDALVEICGEAIEKLQNKIAKGFRPAGWVEEKCLAFIATCGAMAMSDTFSMKTFRKYCKSSVEAMDTALAGATERLRNASPYAPQDSTAADWFEIASELLGDGFDIEKQRGEIAAEYPYPAEAAEKAKKGKGKK